MIFFTLLLVKEGLLTGDFMKKQTNCESCMNFYYDEECGYYVCLVNLDEDEMAKFMSSAFYNCPYYHLYDEYKIAKKQM